MKKISIHNNFDKENINSKFTIIMMKKVRSERIKQMLIRK